MQCPLICCSASRLVAVCHINLLQCDAMLLCRPLSSRCRFQKHSLFPNKDILTGLTPSGRATFHMPNSVTQLCVPPNSPNSKSGSWRRRSVQKLVARRAAIVDLLGVCNTLHHTATRCNTLQTQVVIIDLVVCNMLQTQKLTMSFLRVCSSSHHSKTLQHISTHCNTAVVGIFFARRESAHCKRCTATHLNTLQHRLQHSIHYNTDLISRHTTHIQTNIQRKTYEPHVRAYTCNHAEYICVHTRYTHKLSTYIEVPKSAPR